MSGKRGPNRSSFGADQRIAAHQVDVIVDHHQRARREAGVDAAGGVGQDQRLDAEQAEHARRERHRPQVVPFVEVRAARPAPRRAARRACRRPAVPAWPMTVDAGQCGMLAVRHRHGVGRACRRSRRGPSRARWRRRARRRRGSRTSVRGGLRPGRSSPIASQQEPGDRRGHEVGQRAGEHRAQAEPRQVVPPVRRQRADAADLDADRAEVGEPAQREGRDRERLADRASPSAARAASRRRTRSAPCACRAGCRSSARRATARPCSRRPARTPSRRSAAG